MRLNALNRINSLNSFGAKKAGQDWSSYWTARFISDLVVIEKSATSIQLDWTNNGIQDYDNICIERSVNGYTFTEITNSLAANTATYTDTVTANYNYYRLRYKKGTSYSDYCTVVGNTIPLLIFNANTVAWYDSQDLTTITKDGSNRVARWNDKLGSGHDLLQATNDAKPTWSTSGVTTDGTDDFMATDTFTYNQPEFFYGVMTRVSPKNNAFMLDGLLGGTNNRMAFYNGADVGVLDINVSAGNVIPVTAIPGTDLFIVKILFNGASSKYIMNDNAAVIGDFGANNASGITIGRHRTQTTGYFANMTYMELIFRNSADTTANESIITKYLKDKYKPISVASVDKVILMGDKSGGEDQTVSNAVNTVLMAQTPDMIIGTGDFDGDALTTANLFTNLSGTIYATPGNHDDWAVGTRTGFNQYYGGGGYKVIKTTHVDFFLYDYYLKTDESGYYTLSEAEAISLADRQASAQGQWLINRILRSTAKWKVVVMHNPPWASPSNYGTPNIINNATNMRWDWSALGVDLLVCGHFHFYERLVKNTGSGNVPVILVGNSGTTDHLGWTSVDSDSEFIVNELTDAHFVGGMLVEMNISESQLQVDLSGIDASYNIHTGKDQLVLTK